MKVIIDIPEEEYKECKNRIDMIYQEGYLNYNLNTALVLYVANGIPLTENHGRLIDADKFIDLVEDMVDEKYVRNVISLVELAVISEENSCKNDESEEEE